ncbi:methyltransferase [Amycolatopsis sp. NPDC059027]|uniref:methyltransferase n=1 Tax=unclassified Amycolatopsis TaxID=2618356 RepID=UPI00366F15A9
MTTPMSATPSARPIIELGTAFWGAKALLSAVEIGLFTELGNGQRTAEYLQEKLDLHPRGARDLLDSLVALGMLEREDGQYRNTDATGYFLDENKETYLGGWMRRASTDLFGAWTGLTESLRTGKPADWGNAEVFEHIYEEMEGRRSFLAAMDAWTTHIARELAAGLDWSGYREFVDVGGARGNLSAGLVKAQKHLSGTVFDRPEIEPLFDEHMRRHGTAERVGFVVGDFFTDDLPESDVLILGHILHDWNPDERRRLVAQCHRALRPGGILVTYDRMLDDERRRNATGLLGCLNLLVVTTGGSEYTVAECRSYATAAGFASTTTLPLYDGLETAVIAKKAL